MKRLSDLPERDRTDETQKLTGNNPVKLLVNSPTEDVLVKPEDLLPKITGVSGSSDMWANLEQIKEAYEKGSEAPSKIELADFQEWVKAKFPKCQNNNTLIIYLPKTKIVRNKATTSSYLLDNTFAKKDIFLTISTDGVEYVLPYYSDKNLYFTSDATSKVYSPRFPGSATVTNNKTIINYPNLTRCTGHWLFENGRLYNSEVIFLLPKCTSGFMFGQNYMSNSTVKLYIPQANDTIYFYNGRGSSSRMHGMNFTSIKYLLDNINKAPSSGHRDYPYAVLSNMRAPSSFTDGENITINYTDSTSTEQTVTISDVVVEAGERMVDAIKRKVKNTDSLKDVLDVFSTSASEFYISGPKGSIINSVESTVNLITVPSGAITPKEDTAGQPLLIYCGVDESLGTYIDPTNKSKGWIPTGTFGDYIGQFLLDCAGKWNIVWYPATHV